MQVPSSLAADFRVHGRTGTQARRADDNPSVSKLASDVCWLRNRASPITQAESWHLVLQMPSSLRTYLAVQAMKKAGINPAIISAFEKTGRLVTEDNQHLLSDQDLDEWQATIEEYEGKHHKRMGSARYPMGTVAFYGLDDNKSSSNSMESSPWRRAMVMTIALMYAPGIAVLPFILETKGKPLPK